MESKRVLYVSSSVGLGHVWRDVAIARALRRRRPEVDIVWLAAHPATLVLQETGEKLVSEADHYAVDTVVAERVAKGYKLNVAKYYVKAQKAWDQNLQVFKDVISREHFDVIVQDEAFDIVLALFKEPEMVKVPLVGIQDVFELPAMTRSPVERLVIYSFFRTYAQGNKKLAKVPARAKDLNIFVGETRDIPSGKLGFLLPSFQEFARSYFQCVGYTLPFDPADYADQSMVRAKLGYGKEPLVICAIGGTSVGKDLLDLCGRTYPLLKDKIPSLRLRLVCGPRLAPESLMVPAGVEVVGYLPALYEHLAACDLAIVQGGGSTTLELTALRRPFFYFPLAEHTEQQITVAGRNQRHGAGIKMAFSRTTPALLAEEIVANLEKPATWAPIRTDGAERTAELISQRL